MKPKVYIETSVVSYLVGRPSKDIIVAARQVITYDWWHSELHKFEPRISSYVIDEAESGDNSVASKRLEALAGFPLLKNHENIDGLAQAYLDNTQLPEKCRLDCLHMATASFYAVAFLVSWNCKHIVNGIIIEKISQVNQGLGLKTPNIRTPEELYGD